MLSVVEAMALMKRQEAEMEVGRVQDAKIFGN